MQLRAVSCGTSSFENATPAFPSFYMHDLDLGMPKDASRLQERSRDGRHTPGSDVLHQGAHIHEDTVHVGCFWKLPLVEGGRKEGKPQ